MDILSPEKRSAIMARIRSKGTAPEKAVARILRPFGVKFRSHPRFLPGTPDFMLKDQRKVIFVHGCFWHQHCKCADGRLPKSNVRFWRTKLQGNMRRDIRAARRLRKLGYGVITVWECEISKPETLLKRLWRAVHKGHSKASNSSEKRRTKHA
jgi:DNA mismatch endonuclease (patch repair protein)